MMKNDDDIHGFMKQSDRFKNAGTERQWHLLNAEGNEIGFVWFKNILGGWRIQLNSDTGDEWDYRGVIDTVTQLQSFLSE